MRSILKGSKSKSSIAVTIVCHCCRRHLRRLIRGTGSLIIPGYSYNRTTTASECPILGKQRPLSPSSGELPTRYQLSQSSSSPFPSLLSERLWNRRCFTPEWDIRLLLYYHIVREYAGNDNNPVPRISLRKCRQQQ